MKKFLLSLFIASCTLGSFAQTSLTEAVDFTVTFTDGEEFNLFDKLAEGKWVCIDWFFTTCGPCQSNQPYYTETFSNFGCNEGDIFFLSIETTVDDAATIAYEENFAGDNAPPAASGTDGGGINAEGPYQIAAYPTFILINPDGNIVEQDMWPLTDGAATFTSYFESHGLSQMACSTSVEEMSNEASFVAYPNPTQDNLNVKINGFDGIVNVALYNVLGETVYESTTNSNLELISVSELSAGNYTISIFNDTQMVNQHVSIIR